MSNANEPLYTTVASVKARLSGKVQFQQDPKELVEGELPNDLLLQLIIDAETDIELELMHRYSVPFQHKNGSPFTALSNHTKRAIRMVVDMRAVALILTTDFGRGTHVSGDNYAKDNNEKLEEKVNWLLGRNPEAAGKEIDRYRFAPPLKDLLLAETNRMADDGYRGMVINTSESERDAVSYAEEQLNNPGLSTIRKRGVVR